MIKCRWMPALKEPNRHPGNGSKTLWTKPIARRIQKRPLTVYRQFLLPATAYKPILIAQMSNTNSEVNRKAMGYSDNANRVRMNNGVTDKALIAGELYSATQHCFFIPDDNFILL
jgi:hypothetical protein